MMTTALRGLAAAAEAVTGTREIIAARHRTGATMMSATGVGHSTFRQHVAAAQSHTNATTSDHRSFNSGFPVVALVFFLFFSRQRRPWRSPAQRRDGMFDCRCVAIISVVHHGKRPGFKKKRL